MVRYRAKRLKDIPDELKPREKLLKHGEGSLSEAELLAIILGTGTRDKDVLTLAEELISAGWKRLRRMSASEIMGEFGLGKAKSSQIKALLELSERISKPGGDRRILSPSDAHLFLMDKMEGNREKLIALYLDLSNRVLDYEVIAVGSINRVFAQPKEVLKRAVELSAYGILISHNHPQGVLEPSQEDILFTERLKKACDMLGFELIDHLIINHEGYISFKEEELLP